MSRIIVRTNPNRKRFITGEAFECSQCHKPVNSFDEGVACATADYERRVGISPAEREAA